MYFSKNISFITKGKQRFRNFCCCDSLGKKSCLEVPGFEPIWLSDFQPNVTYLEIPYKSYTVFLQIKKLWVFSHIKFSQISKNSISHFFPKFGSGSGSTQSFKPILSFKFIDPYPDPNFFGWKMVGKLHSEKFGSAVMGPGQPKVGFKNFP